MLDASAILAYLDREPGFEIVRQALRIGATASVVNLAEVYSKLISRGANPTAISSRLPALGLNAVSFEHEDALAVGRLWSETRSYGMSLGDRACLALARRLSLPALTADRVWSELPNLGIGIQVIR